MNRKLFFSIEMVDTCNISDASRYSRTYIPEQEIV
jgi:hypothetical protein